MKLSRFIKYFGPAEMRLWWEMFIYKIKRPLFSGVVNSMSSVEIEHDDDTKISLDEAMVSIIIPSKNNFDMLLTLIQSIKRVNAGAKYEIIVVDNGSIEAVHSRYADLCKVSAAKYDYDIYPFNFSKMCNRGRKLAKGNILLFLNDDMEVKEDGWLAKMISEVIKADSGAIGALLQFPDGRLQHRGIVSGFFPTQIDYGRNMSELNGSEAVSKYPAVTGACLMVRADIFDKVGGFDENLPTHYNDVDLCFSLEENGYRNKVRNDVKLIHYESVSRGKGLDMTRAQRKKWLYDRRYLANKHKIMMYSDKGKNNK